MRIGGVNKTTLLDYPGKVAATVFLSGCNFRCPFCHNSSLVLPGHPEHAEQRIEKEEILAFLKKRRSILDGVCITGGEPTLAPDLTDFIKEIKEIGLAVKLDTNGSSPNVLKSLLDAGLIDYVAMDIKSSPEQYAAAAGVEHLDLKQIRKSVEILLASSISYEFRTTVVKELHRSEDFQKIGEWIRGANAYYLQSYKDSPEVLIPGFHSCTGEELKHFQEILFPYVENTFIRGVEE